MCEEFFFAPFSSIPVWERTLWISVLRGVSTCHRNKWKKIGFEGGTIAEADEKHYLK